MMPTPNWWHYIALAVIIALVALSGGIIDHRLYAYPAIQALAQQRSADTQASNDAKQTVQKQIGVQDNATQTSLEYWKSQAISLSAALERMRKQPAINQQHLSSVADSTSAVHEEIGQFSGIGKGQIVQPCFGSSADPCEVSRNFYENALDDADMLNNGWQDWAVRQGIPVK